MKVTYPFWGFTQVPLLVRKATPTIMKKTPIASYIHTRATPLLRLVRRDTPTITMTSASGI